MLERDGGTKLRAGFHLLVVLFGPAQHEALEVGIGNVPGPFQRPERGARPFEDASRHVGRHDFHTPSGTGRARRQQAHGDRERLFTGRASRAPGTHTPRALACFCLSAPFGQDDGFEILELPRLPEEMRLVGADTVDQLDALVGISRIGDALEIR